MAMCDGKQPYKTEKMAATGAAMLEGKRIDTLFWYECPICGSWHLTRDPKENVEYYTKMKREIIAKYNKPITVKAKAAQTHEHLAITRHKMAKNCMSLDEIVKWNEENAHLKISLKKASKKMDPKYVEAWMKAHPEAQ